MTPTQRDWLDPSLSAWDPAGWVVADDWRTLVDDFFAAATGRALQHRLQERIAAGATVYPPHPLRALALTPLHAVKVVILGQDPYHGPGQANGLAFSVSSGMAPPPSLRNIRLELTRERQAGELELPPVATTAPATSQGDLTPWAQQGVLLLNACLSVERGLPASQAQWGWEALTLKVIEAVGARPAPTVFMLWGKHAQASAAALGDAVPAAPRLLLHANHPSPLSARRPPVPFIGCGHFAQANKFLRDNGVAPIVW